MSITRFFLIAIAAMLLFGAGTAEAQSENKGRDRILAELKPYKHDFLIKELKLSKEQANEFLAIYDAMDEELQNISDETREIERTAIENASATDSEIEIASYAAFMQKQKESVVELSYYEKFKEILTPRQLLKLKPAERRFTQWLARSHRKLLRGRNQQENDSQR